MIKCCICSREFKNYRAIGVHIKITHKISTKEYYDKYLKKEDNGICLECGKETNFDNITKGYYKFCSYTCIHKFHIVRNKLSNTKLNKSDKEKELIRKKIIKTFIEKYGCENPNQSKKIREKTKKTNLLKYGCENPSQTNQVKEKLSKSYHDKSNEEKELINKKRIKTNLERFNLDYFSKTYEYKNKIKNTRLNNILDSIDKFFKHLNLELLSEYKNSKENIKVKCTKCNTIFETKYNYIQQGFGKCLKCFPIFQRTSKLEKELLEYIKSIETSEIIENDRTILNGKELDIYIPSKNIAIEFNGLYWHSENNGKDKYYHLNKTNECLKNNIRLIHIFEDEWILKQDIVKSRLKQILGLSNSERIHARKCEIKEISPKVKNQFLNTYHIQGEDKSNIKLGAFYNDELVSVMTFSKGSISKGSKNIDGVYELSRFCSNSNYHIQGIASKLLSHFKRNYEWKEIYSYADRRWSQGNVYDKIGFELSHITKPNYFYIGGGIDRIHRFNLRKRPDEPKDIPEWVLRQGEGYHRIWDCGHYKFIMINPF